MLACKVAKLDVPSVVAYFASKHKGLWIIPLKLPVKGLKYALIESQESVAVNTLCF